VVLVELQDNGGEIVILHAMAVMSPCVKSESVRIATTSIPSTMFARLRGFAMAEPDVRMHPNVFSINKRQ
jgi:hypothetical protein